MSLFYIHIADFLLTMLKIWSIILLLIAFRQVETARGADHKTKSLGVEEIRAREDPRG